MQFLYPSVLWGLGAVAVPIAIHLFNFRRARRVAFTNVALLRAVQTETKSFRRLRHWWLLALRCGFIICAVLAFAQPFWSGRDKPDEQRSTDAQTAQSQTSLYLDNSYSMQQRQNGRPLLDAARARLDELLLRFQRQAPAYLVTNDFGTAEQTPGPPDALRDRVASLSLSPQTRTLAAVYRRQRNLLNAPGGRSGTRLFWISDFQKSTAGDLATVPIDSADRLFLVPVTAPATANVFVDSVWLSTPFVREGQNNRLNVRLRNSGPKPVQNLPVQLLLNGVQATASVVSLPANGAATTQLAFSVMRRGTLRGRVTFGDQPVTFDNDYFFVLEPTPAVRVLHLYEQPPQPNYVQAVYHSDSLFRYRGFSVRNVDVGLLRSTDLVVLENATLPEGALPGELARFVRTGGSLLVIPPARPDVRYVPWLASMNVTGVQTTDTTALQSLAAPDQRIPFWQDVFERSVQPRDVYWPQARPVWRWQSGERLLSLRDGRPFLTRQAFGRGGGRIGAVYVLGNPLNVAWGDLATQNLFIPIMYKIAAGSARASRSAYSFDEGTITLPVSEATERSVYQLKHDKLTLIPVQRVVNGQLQLELPKAEQLGTGQNVASGYYDLQLVGKAGPPERVLALNHGRAESQMAFYSADELKKLFANRPNVTVYDGLDDATFTEQLTTGGTGRGLWPWFLLAALAFLAGEVALLRLNG